MKTLDFTVISNLTIGITTIAFSSNDKLVNILKTYGFKEVITNKDGLRFTKQQLIDFLSKCDVAIIGLDKIDEEILQYTPKLKAISKYGVGLDNINFDDCKKYNVEILHTSGINKRSVSELTLGFMLSLCRNIYTTSNLLKNNSWNKSGGVQLSNKTIGIIGVGNIGKDLVQLLKPFNCKILVNDIIKQDEYYKENGLIEVSKDEIFLNSDIITIHTPLDSTTKYLINKDTLKLMKPSCFLINTARGEIVNQDDLKLALQNNIISGAAIDVYEQEPPTDYELIKIQNLITTPHIGGNSAEAVEAMGISAIDNIVRWIKG